VTCLRAEQIHAPTIISVAKNNSTTKLPLFQRALVFGPAQRAVQRQSLRCAHRPDHRFHRVPDHLLERRQALVAVDD